MSNKKTYKYWNNLEKIKIKKYNDKYLVTFDYPGGSTVSLPTRFKTRKEVDLYLYYRNEMVKYSQMVMKFSKEIHTLDNDIKYLRTVPGAWANFWAAVKQWLADAGS